jgi:hypothetical protein
LTTSSEKESPPLNLTALGASTVCVAMSLNNRKEDGILKECKLKAEAEGMPVEAVVLLKYKSTE